MRRTRARNAVWTLNWVPGSRGRSIAVRRPLGSGGRVVGGSRGADSPRPLDDCAARCRSAALSVRGKRREQVPGRRPRAVGRPRQATGSRNPRCRRGRDRRGGEDLGLERRSGTCGLASGPRPRHSRCGRPHRAAGRVSHSLSERRRAVDRECRPFGIRGAPRSASGCGCRCPRAGARSVAKYARLAATLSRVACSGSMRIAASRWVPFWGRGLADEGFFAVGGRFEGRDRGCGARGPTLARRRDCRAEAPCRAGSESHCSACRSGFRRGGRVRGAPQIPGH